MTVVKALRIVAPICSGESGARVLRLGGAIP